MSAPGKAAAAEATGGLGVVTMKLLAEIIISGFVNGGLHFNGAVTLLDPMTLRKQLQMGPKEFALLAAHLSDLLGEDLPELESAATVLDLKNIIMDSLVRMRDALELKLPCASCQRVVPAPSRCARCKATVYCSRECQVAHWKQHKRACVQPQHATDLGTLDLRRQPPPQPDHGLRFQYSHSIDKFDCNLLIVLHGNGDNEQNFARFISKFPLGLTALLSVRAPHPLAMKGQIWYQDVDPHVRLPAGDRTRVRPCVESAEMLVQLIRSAERQWKPHRMFLLGHGHGGVIAVEAASRYEKYLGGVVASGDCVLDEVVRDFVAPTTVEKREATLGIGEQMLFNDDVEVTLALSQSLAPDDATCTQWRFELSTSRKGARATRNTYTIKIDVSELDNARSRGRLINAYDGLYRMRVSGYRRDAVHVAIETTVEAAQDPLAKSATRIFYTHGAKDTIANPALVPAKIDYINRKFRFVEERTYASRQDVLGSSPEELSDIVAYLIKCQVHQALKYVPPVAGRIKN